jgi:hypothetical protein
MEPKWTYCDAHQKNGYDKRGAETVRNKRWKEAHTPLRIYPCPDCKMWHVTEDESASPKRKKRRLP